MDVNAAVAAVAAIAGALTGVIAMLAFRVSEREQKRPTRTSLHTDPVLPPGVDTVLSVLRSSAVVLDEADGVVKASSAAYALGLVRGGKLAVEPMLQMARDTRRDGEIRQVELDLPRRGTGRGEALAVSARVAPSARGWFSSWSRTSRRPAASRRYAATSSRTSATSSRPRSAPSPCCPRPSWTPPTTPRR